MKYDKEKVGQCIKEKANWGVLDKIHKFDNKEFDAKKVKEKIAYASPKLELLLNKIKELDEQDMREHGQLFKHFIYSDIKSAYGAKLIASGLAAMGFKHAYGLEKTARGMSFTLNKKELAKKSSNVFATLTSVTFFEKSIGINFRKELLKEFNSRPDNNHGEKIRIIILDSGFREGVDLFDIKYVHLFEPIITKSDEKQAIGRATRFCGQKGLKFDSVYGWPIHVYRYESELTSEMQRYLLSKNKELFAPADTFFNLFLKFSNIDPKKVVFANELEKVATGSAIDRDLTKEVHDFKLPEFKHVGGSYASLKEKINKKYAHLKWPKVEVKNACKGGATILPFTPTQEFVRNYFNPEYPNPGMLLWHSVGTGKTCTAIATASSSFELEDYSILYVTRYTLKGDVWKNMFDQACSVIIQDYLKSGKELPAAQAAKLRMLSQGWFEPMSYRQLSNLLEGKNKMYEKLIERNGKRDPLHKTLIIIDEAHKLFAADVEGQEKADIDVIKKAFDHSIQTSGKDGVKVLLMTATPYTSDPMDLMRLLNLIRPADNKFPETFEEFAPRYLNENGEFTEEGKNKFYEELSGYISYLNREKDIRSFSYPVVHDIKVPMSNYEFINMIEHYYSIQKKYEMTQLNYNQNKLAVHSDVNQFKKRLEEEAKESLRPKYIEREECVKNLNIDMLKQKNTISKHYQDNLKKCEQKIKELLQEIKAEYKEIIKILKEETKATLKTIKDKDEKQKVKDKMKEQIEHLKIDQLFDEEQVYHNIDIQQCKEDAINTYKLELQNVKQPTTKEECDKIEKEIKEFLSKKEEEDNVLVEEYRQRELDNLKIDKERLNSVKKEYTVLKTQIDTSILNDKSQMTGLEKCLEKIVKEPLYKVLLRGDSIMDDEEIEEEIEQEGLKDNVYLVVGHGGETVVNFKKRTKMPNDKVLVVFPVCARPNFMDSGCKFMDMFNTPAFAKWMRNPIKYKKEIVRELNRPIRIYLPGEYVPEMTTNLFLDFKKNTTVIAKSGVFRLNNIPEMNRSVMRLPTAVEEQLGSPLCKRYAGVINKPLDYTSKVHHEVFKGNVYKPAAVKNSYSYLQFRSFKINDILKEVGPGIYFYTGCRVSHANIEPEQYLQVLDESERQQEVSKRTEKIKHVLEKIKGVKSTTHSSKSESKSESKSKSDIKLIKNTKEEKAELNKISDELNKISETLESIDDLPIYKEKLEKMNKTIKVVNLLDKITDLTEFYNNKEKATDTLIIKEVGSFYKYMIVSLIKLNKKTHHFNSRIYGYIPSNAKNTNLKCSAKLLKKQIIKLYNKKIMIELPKETTAWSTSNSDKLFETICKTIKN